MPTGCCSPGEPEDQFDTLCGEMEAEWQPVGPTEEHYVEQMVAARWKLRRVEACASEFYEESIHQSLPLIDRLWKAEQRFENSFIRAQHELERLQAARLDSCETAQLAEIEKAPRKTPRIRRSPPGIHRITRTRHPGA